MLTLSSPVFSIETGAIGSITVLIGKFNDL